MKNYYDECLEKIETLLNEGNENDALNIINEELSMIYIPKEFEEKLIELKKDFIDSKPSKTILPCTFADSTFISVLLLLPIYSLLKPQTNSGVSLHGNNFISPRTPCVPTILPHSINSFFIFNT